MFCLLRHFHQNILFLCKMFLKFILCKHGHLILIGVCWGPVYPLIPGVCQSVFCVFFADIDECVNNTICDSHGFCDNTAGSFRCLCYQGFQAPQDGQGCVGEFLDLFSPNTFHISLCLEKKSKLSTTGESAGKVIWTEFHRDLILSPNLGLCKNVLWLWNS